MTQFLANAATQGEPALAYLFEEAIETFVHRSETFGLPVSDLRESGSLFVEEIDALSLSPEEFAHQVRRQVRDHDVELVAIDGIAGYKSAIKSGEADVALRRRLRALIQGLVRTNASVMLVDQRREVTGFPEPTSESVSHLADNIVFQNYVEDGGELKRVVGVLKKRVGGFETVPRRFEITSDGLEVGEPASGMHGVFEDIPDRYGAG